MSSQHGKTNSDKKLLKITQNIESNCFHWLAVKTGQSTLRRRSREGEPGQGKGHDLAEHWVRRELSSWFLQAPAEGFPWVSNMVPQGLRTGHHPKGQKKKPLPHPN